MKRNIIGKWLGITFVCFWLVACCDSSLPGAICPGMGLQRIYTQADFVNMLTQQGVKIILTGETYRIIIPADTIFYPDSANFSPNAINVLHPLVAFLLHYETTMMKVSGFTDSEGSLERNRALSEKQAQRMIEYLTRQGLDARIIYAAGYGPNYPIGDNSIPSHQQWNRRVEIKFRRVVLAPLV